MNAISVQDTLIYVMVSIAAVDRDMNDTEMMRIGNVAQILPIFERYHDEQWMNAVKSCGDILQEDEGLETILGIAANLPDNLKETAYALAAEIAASDRKISAEEIRLLQMFRSQLGLDKLTCAALERGAIARHQCE